MSVSPVVGAALLYAGVVKAADVRQAERVLLQHVSFIPCHRVRIAIGAMVSFESALGAALVLRVAPAIVLPVAAAFLLAATWFSVRSLRAGQTEDCGCYGNLRVPTAVSIGLNAIFVVALAADGWALGAAPPVRPGFMVVAIAYGVAAGVVAWCANGKAIVDMSALRVGRRWRRAWSGDVFDFRSGEQMVVLMRGSCPHCETWVPFVNIFDRTNAGIATTGLVPGGSRDAETFVAQHGASFRVAAIRDIVFDAIAIETPTAVRLHEGRIVGVWSGNVPPAFVDGAREYYRGLVTEADRPLDHARTTGMHVLREGTRRARPPRQPR